MGVVVEDVLPVAPREVSGDVLVRLLLLLVVVVEEVEVRGPSG